MGIYLDNAATSYPSLKRHRDRGVRAHPNPERGGHRSGRAEAMITTRSAPGATCSASCAPSGSSWPQRHTALNMRSKECWAPGDHASVRSSSTTRVAAAQPAREGGPSSTLTGLPARTII